jgi:hypothetical protein
MTLSGKRTLAAAMLALFATAAGASTAGAAATWIDCTGQMVTTKAGKADAPVATHEIYQIDDAAKALYKYSEARKSADPEPVTTFDDKAVAWAEKPDLGALDSSWEGHLDRASLALTQDYHQGPEVTNWTEQCKATTAPALATTIAEPTPPAPPATAAPAAPADAKKAPAAKKPPANAKSSG